MSTLSVRPAVETDLVAISALETACFSDAWSFKALQSTFDDAKSFLLVATLENRVIGYVTAWSVGDEGELTRIAVFSQFRGQGIGKKLLQAAMQESLTRGVALLFLEVRESNRAAQGLYSLCGFHEVGRRLRYYADGESALILQAPLATMIAE